MRIIVAAIVGGLVAFFWGFFIWAVNPFGDALMRRAMNEPALMQAVDAATPEPGIYFFPFQTEPGADEAAVEAMMQAHERGPIGYVVVNEGTPVNMPLVLGRGFAIYVFNALMLALVLGHIKTSAYVSRVLISALIGVFMAGMAHLVNWNFMYFPTDGTIIRIIDSACGITLMGAVMALIIKPVTKKKN